MNVISNVLLRDYQIKLIPHINSDNRDEAEKALDLTNEEALDILKRNQVDGTEYQRRIDNYIMHHMDEKFYNKYHSILEESGLHYRGNNHMNDSKFEDNDVRFKMNNISGGEMSKLKNF